VAKQLPNGISWTDETWNPIRGCSRVSEGCRNCYAEAIAARFSGTDDRGNVQPYAGLAEHVVSNGRKAPRWTGDVRLVERALDWPLRRRGPKKIFVNSMSDLFHEKVADKWIDRIFAVMALAREHTFQILTKRPQRMRAYLSAARAHPVGLEALGLTLECYARDPKSQVGSGVILQGDVAHLKVWPLPNVWLGVSAEDQATADGRIPLLLETPAAVRFVSYEPALGPVDFTRIVFERAYGTGLLDALTGKRRDHHYRPLPHPEAPGEAGPRRIDWVICGGESGPHARPMHADWARSARDQCAAAAVPFFFKQWGEHAPTSDANGPYMTRVGKQAAGRLLDGVLHDAFPPNAAHRAAA